MPQITEANRKKNNKRNQAGVKQTPKELIPTTELKNAFKNPTAHPPNTTTVDGLKIDSKQSHHSGVPLDSFTSFTEGFTEEQILATRIALERQGLLTGDHLLNSIDLWKRYHQGRSSGPYHGKGAHQRSNKLQIDGAKSKQRWESFTPEERFNQLERFVSDMGVNRQIAQESDFASRQLLGKDNTADNVYGGNFTQRILSPRNPDNAARNAANAKAQRELYKPSVPRDMSPATRQARNVIVAQSAFESEILDQVPPNAFASVISSKVPPKTTSAPQSTVRTPTTTTSTPKPTQTKTKPTGYVHRNRTPSETPPVTASKTPPPTVLENLNTGIQNTLKIGGAIGAGALAIGKDMLFGFSP